MEEVFKGYAKGKGKSPTQKVKDENLISLEEASKHGSYGGILHEGFIDISFDSKELSDKFWNMADENNWNCLIINNPTNEHIHSYWKIPKNWRSKDGKDKKLAVGLVADVHSKGTYIPLKVDNVKREIEFEPDEIDEVPDELFPVQTNISLLDLEEGDGRNDTLFRYILILQSQLTMDEESVKGVLNNINQFVLKEPLSSKELETITREEAFAKPIFYNGKSFLHDKFGNYMISQEHIIKINGRLHIYHNGIYSDNVDELNSAIREKIPTIKKSQKTEVLDYIKDVAPETELSSPNLIAFRNGVYNLETDELFPLSPSYVLTNLIPWDYNSEAYNKLCDDTLNKISCHDDSIRKVIEEMIGYCFYRNNEFLEKSFILTGEKANGKSTILKVLHTLLGKDNVSSLDLKNIGDRFSKASLLKKLANIGDDISDEFIVDPSLFKKIVSGNTIQAEFKGQTEFSFSPYCKLIFSSNNIPRIKDKTGAVLRRMIIIPFNARFSEDDEDFDPHIKKKLCSQESIEYMIQLGIQGLKRLMKENRFTKSEKVQEQIEEYKETNNPVIQFVNSLDDGVDWLTRNSVTDVYSKYKEFCYLNGLTPESNVQFGKSIHSLYDLTSKQVKINKKNVRMYARVTDGNR